MILIDATKYRKTQFSSDRLLKHAVIASICRTSHITTMYGHYESIYHINKECYGFSADGRFCFVAVSFTMGFLIHSLRFATNCQPPDDVRASVQHCVYCVLYAYDKQTAKCARNSYSSHTVNGQRTLLHEFVEYMNKEYISCINGPLKYFSCAFFENSVDVCWLFSV